MQFDSIVKVEVVLSILTDEKYNGLRNVPTTLQFTAVIQYHPRHFTCTCQCILMSLKALENGPVLNVVNYQ